MSDVQKSRQRVFDKALAHLRAQKKLSMGYIGCAYRGDEGAKCAIGIFIPDGKYSKSMEGKRVDCDVVFPALSKSVSETGYQFLSDIQNYLHDDVPDSDFHAGMERSAKELAALYDLKYSAPESIA